MPNSRQPLPNALSDPGFDRAAHRRLDEAWLQTTRLSAEAHVVPVWRSKSLVVTKDNKRFAAAVPASSFDWTLASDTVFLGISGGIPRFAADVSALEAEAVADHLGPHGTFEDMRMIGQFVPSEDAALLAYAKGILWWHERHQFCGVCGHRTQSIDGGHRRLCTNEVCKAEQFPRSDPAVIMLVVRDDKILMGHASRFPEGMYSTLAGFVEPGESLEEAVRREVYEETGVRVGAVAYHSSQPWPFPSSLMLGFYGEGLSEAIEFRDSELADARWFTRAMCRAPDEHGFKLPGPDSIARRLIEDWLVSDTA